MEPVQNLELITPIQNDILTITWTGHKKQEQCNIQYQVKYEYGSFQETFTTSQTTMDFSLIYDVTITIRVKAISGDKESEESIIRHTESTDTNLI